MPGPDEQIPRGFPPTQDSALEAARSAHPADRARGLSRIAALYWRPVYGYLRLRWHRPHDEAADLAQELFAQLVSRDLLARFDPRRARLRTFLRLQADGLAANSARAAAQKARREAPWDPADLAQARGELDSAAASPDPPDALFEREWARTLFAAALQGLRERCGREGKPAWFALYEQYEIEPADPRPTYAALARRHGLSVTDVTNRLAWVRRELRAAVLGLLREATCDEAEFRAEARALLGVEPG